MMWCYIEGSCSPVLGGNNENGVQGRHILWGWLQERRKVGSYDYAGCLSLPRVMYISGNRLHQVQILQNL